MSQIFFNKSNLEEAISVLSKFSNKSSDILSSSILLEIRNSTCRIYYTTGIINLEFEVHCETDNLYVGLIIELDLFF